MARGHTIAGIVAAALALAAAAGAGVTPPPLITGVYDPASLSGPDAATAAARIRAAGATFVRLRLDWAAVAGSSPGADGADPANAAYDWSSFDAQLQAVVTAGLTPIVDVLGTPRWAAGDGTAPAPANLQAFAAAAARHYDGSTEGLPRVRYWQIWNEPNLNNYLEPQFVDGTPHSPGVYRSMTNAFAAGVKSVDSTNLVVAGGLAPYGIQQKGQALNGVLSVAPLRFMRELLCMSAGAHPHPTCGAKVAFDIFSIHPYTWGGPTHSAYSSDDTAIGDLPEVQALLGAAWRAGHIRAPARPPLWVTEFSWDTNPPDPRAISTALQARWTSEALYRMWKDGVGVVTWFLLRDMPLSTPFQSGLYLAGPTLATDSPKPTLRAFRFPFVAFPAAHGVTVWGRTPAGTAASVAIQRRDGSAWRTVLRLPAARNGIFQGSVPVGLRQGYLRARLADGSDVSLPFGLQAVPDRRISPFG